MDVQSLTFKDDVFDAATSRFGLSSVPILCAAHRTGVCSSRGKFATAVWDVPAKNPFFTSIAGVLAGFVPIPPPTRRAGGVRLAPPVGLERVLRAAGFSMCA